ncbi:MAG TPA: hypothetical protein VD833_19780 [Vicinamibacterales bacterium]|nr:hypothetical protein [Vicinamibacterales bacterium]
MSRLMPGPLVLVLVASAAAAPVLTAPESSTKPANELVALMKARQLDAVAVEDPAAPGRFVAAMLIPDVQLLAVAGSSTAADYLRAMMAQRNYAEVYSILHSAVAPETKLFFQDMDCDGLGGAGGGSVDIMYERGTSQTIFNGDWRGQKLSKQDYEEKFRRADSEYGRMLTLLADALRESADPGSRF